MKQFAPEHKHSILLEYTPHSTTHSFAALAARHGVAGGERVVRRWHQQWDGTARSLQHKAGAGRPRALNRREVQQHVRTPILRANRAHKAVHYSKLLPQVQQKTGKDSEEKMMQEFHDWGCQELTEIVKMPPAAAKRLSPLDNSLFNLWRQRVLSFGPLTKTNIKQRMSDAWNTITSTELLAQYRNCGLLRHQDVYFDCPNPSSHRHRS